MPPSLALFWNDTTYLPVIRCPLTGWHAWLSRPERQVFSECRAWMREAEARGMRLNYAGVIIGPDLRFDRVEGMLFIDRAPYFDV